MKSILIVDDEKPFLLSLKDGLNSHDPDLNIHTAADGQQAVDILKEHHVDLLITDLKLPVMDGFQLLAHVSRTEPDLPAVVMTAFGTPEIEARLAEHNTLHYLEKPLDFEALVKTIDQALANYEQSYIKGITLATFLQLVQMEKKSCTLKVHSGSRTGYLFIQIGQLIDAACDGLQGEAAAMAIITWPHAEIEMDGVCRRKEKRITSSMDFLLLEAYRLKDEADHVAQQAAPANPSAPPAPEEKDDDAEDKGTSEDLAMAESLANSRLISEWAIFDKLNFLLHQSAAPCSPAKSDPSWHFDLSRELGSHLNCGPLNYLQIQTAQGKRIILLRRRERTLAVTLKHGVKPNQFMDELTSLF